MKRLFRTVVCLLAVSASGSVTPAQSVRIVDPVGDKVFSSIQSAVSAADDGAVLLVARGTYPGFTVHDKWISIVARPGDSVLVSGTVNVTGLTQDKDVWLSGLTVQALAGAPGLKLASNLGAVRVIDCTFTGGVANPRTGGPGAEILAGCANVALVGCTFQGGDGLYDEDDSHAGPGLAITLSSVAVYDCFAAGGDGKMGYKYQSGHGGDGARFTSASQVFVSGSRFVGGRGGDARGDPFAWGTPGDGGTGIFVGAGCTAELLDNQYQPGLGGFCYHGYCYPGGFRGQALGGPGTKVQHPGSAREFQCTSVQSDGTDLTISVSAQAGDRIYALPSTSPDYIASTTPPGVWLIDPPGFRHRVPLGVHPQPGGYAFPIPTLTNVKARIARRRLWLQGYAIDALGDHHLGSPMLVLTLMRGSTPDCNGNGINDFVDVVENRSLDSNNNLIPDSCEP